MAPKVHRKQPTNITILEAPFAMLLNQMCANSPALSECSHPSGNSSKCTARFDGDESADVDAFINNFNTHKECINIFDIITGH